MTKKIVGCISALIVLLFALYKTFSFGYQKAFNSVQAQAFEENIKAMTYAQHESAFRLSKEFLIIETAKSVLNGMLAHARRYTPREGRSSNWHFAISEEAFELSEAFVREAKKRRVI